MTTNAMKVGRRANETRLAKETVERLKNGNDVLWVAGRDGRRRAEAAARMVVGAIGPDSPTRFAYLAGNPGERIWTWSHDGRFQTAGAYWTGRATGERHAIETDRAVGSGAVLVAVV